MRSKNTDIAKRCEDLGVIAFDGDIELTLLSGILGKSSIQSPCNSVISSLFI